jgi:hypothetical protein
MTRAAGISTKLWPNHLAADELKRWASSDLNRFRPPGRVHVSSTLGGNALARCSIARGTRSLMLFHNTTRGHRRKHSEHHVSVA